MTASTDGQAWTITGPGRLAAVVESVMCLSTMVPASVVIELSRNDLVAAFDDAGVWTEVRGHRVMTDLLGHLFSISLRMRVAPDESVLRAIFPESILVLLVKDAPVFTDDVSS